jgi:hypothetical protein
MKRIMPGSAWREARARIGLDFRIANTAGATKRRPMCGTELPVDRSRRRVAFTRFPVPSRPRRYKPLPRLHARWFAATFVGARFMLFREFQTLPRMEFADTRASMRSPLGRHHPRNLVAVNFSGRPADVGRRVIHAVVRARAVDEVGALSLRDRAVVDARMG